MGKFFAIDTMAVLYRSHFAMIRNPLINSKGVNVSGLNGLLHTLVRIIEREQPEFLAVVSDTPEPTFRHVQFPEYKATREKMPDELVEQLPYIPRIVEALGLPYLLMPGYEADDIIGTLVQTAAKKGLESYMVTGDKDFMQLVNDHTFMYSAKGEEVKLIDLDGVREKFGCRPDQVIEVLALMGDASDNVPGVRGVGEKTATKLIGEHSNLEGVYAALEGLKGDKLRENLANGKDSAFLSRELVTIKCDVPLAGSFDDLEVHPKALAGNQELVDLLTELEFQTLRDRILKKGIEVEPEKEDAPAVYHTLETMEEIKAVLPRWQSAEMLVVDTETTGLDYFTDKIIGLSFAIAPHEAWYIALNAAELMDRRDEVWSLLRPLLEGEKPLKAGHNTKYDMHMLLGEGIALGGLAHDTMIASHLTAPNERRHDLDSVALRVLGFTKIPTSELIGKGKSQITMDLVEIPTVSHYACEDADITYRLYDSFRPRMAQLDQQKVMDTVEIPLVPVLLRLERAGIRFDQEGAARVSKEMADKLEVLVADIHEMAGESFNINSVPELQKILYGKLNLHEELKVRPKKIKTGLGFSTDEETLEKMASHPLPRALLEYRGLTKLKNTYLDQLGTFVHPTTGKIHTSFRQAVAATGRLASDKPNLQNIPIRTEDGRKVRELFLASDSDHVLLSADYSQIELRVVADYSSDPTFVEAFRTGADIHALTANAIFGAEPDQVTREMRSVAKEVNFGLIYRMGADRLALVTGRNRNEAKEFIQKFFDRYPAVRELQDELAERARKEGYAATKLGRRRYLPEINSSNAFAARIAEGMAVNTPIQGTAAEIIKLAMIAIDRRMHAEGFNSRMVLTIHDELLFDTRRDELEALKKLVAEEMRGAMELVVPLEVEMGTGDNWLAAH